MSNVDEIERLAQLFADNQLIDDQAQTDIDFEYGTQLNESVGSSEKVIDESFDDLNRRTLRSGNHYSTSPKYTKAVTPVTGDSVSVAKSVTTLLTQPSVKSKNTNLLNTNTKMASSKPHTSTTTTPKADNVINIMQRGDYVRNFTGQDDYRVAHFIRACEDSMRNSHITTDEEKKAYVRSHITQGSYAGSRLNAFGLQSPDYEKFKRTLIGIFGGRSQPHSQTPYATHLAPIAPPRLTYKQKTSLRCAHCNKRGHVMEDCFQLRGNSANFKATPGAKPFTRSNREGAKAAPPPTQKARKWCALHKSTSHSSHECDILIKARGVDLSETEVSYRRKQKRPQDKSSGEYQRTPQHGEG